jgi:3-hydroxyacyl-[acyl-carrier-protein] dehydratase
LQTRCITDKNTRFESGPGRLAGKHVKFNLIDKVESITDEKIVAVKYVSLAEEYLADHFPTFPVLPGVMMLEALTQAAAWLLHRRENFRCSMAVLKEARNVKYGHFVAPGNSLRVEVEYFKPTETGATFKASGNVGEKQALSARIELAYFNLGDKQKEYASLDEKMSQHNRSRWSLLEHEKTTTRI